MKDTATSTSSAEQPPAIDPFAVLEGERQQERERAAVRARHRKARSAILSAAGACTSAVREFLKSPSGRIRPRGSSQIPLMQGRWLEFAEWWVLERWVHLAEVLEENLGVLGLDAEDVLRRSVPAGPVCNEIRSRAVPARDIFRELYSGHNNVERRKGIATKLGTALQAQGVHGLEGECYLTCYERFFEELAGVIDKPERRRRGADKSQAYVPVEQVPRQAGTLPEQEPTPSVPVSPEAEPTVVEQESVGLDATVGIFRKDGDIWSIGLDQELVHLKDEIGHSHLSELLRSPHKEMQMKEFRTRAQMKNGPVRGMTLEEALDDGRAPGEETYQETIGSQGLADINRKMTELRQEIEDAEKCRDSGRQIRLQEQLAELQDHLRRDLGLRGVPRSLDDSANKARRRVGAAIKRAIESIEKGAPATAQHLRSSIPRLTGYTLCYSPSHPVTWQT